MHVASRLKNIPEALSLLCEGCVAVGIYMAEGQCGGASFVRVCVAMAT